MPRIINEDIISRIEELAGKGYSKSATGRELNLDRATVRKYWPEKKEKSEVEETPEVKRFLRTSLACSPPETSLAGTLMRRSAR